MVPKSFSVIFLTVCYFSFALSRHLTQAPITGRKANDTWRREAIKKLWDERDSMGYTPISHLAIPGMPKVDLIFKNESASRTGNLKHRFAWALFMWALVEGYIGPKTTVYEASSGNTAVSEAYMARLIGVPFVAVVPNTTEDKKIERVLSYGGRFIKTEMGKNFERAEQEAQENDGFYMNQFSNADKAEEFHQSNSNSKESTNVFYEVLNQLKEENIDAPDFFVHAAGTGGTITSVGRYIKKYLIPTEVVLSDSEFSIYYDYVINGRFKTEAGNQFWISPGMAGTGAGQSSNPVMHGKTTSLQPSVIDLAYKIPDLASAAAMHFLKKVGISGGTSTAMNFVTSLSLAAQKSTHSTNTNRKLTIVVLLADSSTPYEDTYYNLTWISDNFHKHGGLPTLKCWEKIIEHSFKQGDDPLVKGSHKCKHSLTDRFRRRNMPL